MRTDKLVLAPPPLWTRRAWVVCQASAVVLVPPRLVARRRRAVVGARAMSPLRVQQAAWSAESQEPVVQRAVEAAMRAGAQYADARCTRTVLHRYHYGTPYLQGDRELVGLGVRVLVDGYWGFAACPSTTATLVESLARDAVAQARANATGATPRVVDMGHYPAVQGTWMTPVAIDPFTVPIEEKADYLEYWQAYAAQCGVSIDNLMSYLCFSRLEQVLATSDGSLVTQTRIESGGLLAVKQFGVGIGPSSTINIRGIATAGKGWELFLEAKIPEQLTGMREEFQALAAAQQEARPVTVGRYTLVCDGATMAMLVGKTLGLATQLDRALGYEANAGGTSFVDDPLGMVGQFRVAAPAVTVTANRSAAAHLATVQWDDEGVVPRDFTLIQDGVLLDFQTTREQAAWLAPYYAKRGVPVHSHGCAQGQDALAIPLQQRPNLALEPAPAAIQVEDLVANVQDGILLTSQQTLDVDFQARNGLLGYGTMRQIRNGRLGPLLTGGAVLFNTLDCFKHILAVGGASTVGVVSHSPYDPSQTDSIEMNFGHWKGQPPQDTSYSVSAAAATIANQAVIDPLRKA